MLDVMFGFVYAFGGKPIHQNGDVEYFGHWFRTATISKVEYEANRGRGVSVIFGDGAGAAV